MRKIFLFLDQNLFKILILFFCLVIFINVFFVIYSQNHGANLMQSDYFERGQKFQSEKISLEESLRKKWKFYWLKEDNKISGIQIENAGSDKAKEWMGKISIRPLNKDFSDFDLNVRFVQGRANFEKHFHLTSLAFIEIQLTFEDKTYFNKFKSSEIDFTK